MNAGAWISIASLGVTIITILVKIAMSMAKSLTTLTSIEGRLTSLDTANTEAHRRIWGQLETDKDMLADHEIRITVLEHDSKQ